MSCSEEGSGVDHSEGDTREQAVRGPPPLEDWSRIVPPVDESEPWADTRPEILGAAVLDRYLAGTELLRAEGKRREISSRTTQFERYFYMAVVAVAVLAVLAFALVFTGEGSWEYRLGSIALVISGGVYKLRAINAGTGAGEVAERDPR